MSQSFEFYDARAQEAARDAREATLENVRERNLRAEKTWRGLADHALRAKADREKAERARIARKEAEALAISSEGAVSLTRTRLR